MCRNAVVVVVVKPGEEESCTPAIKKVCFSHTFSSWFTTIGRINIIRAFSGREIQIANHAKTSCFQSNYNEFLYYEAT